MLFHKVGTKFVEKNIFENIVSLKKIRMSLGALSKAGVVARKPFELSVDVTRGL